MSENKKFLVDYKNSSEESNDISTSYSSSEDNDIECRISKNMDIQDFEFLVERCGIDSKYIYDAIKSIELKYENYIFLSKCSYVDKKDKEDLKDCFKNIKHEDFDFIPDCIEEIFLLTVSQYWRSTVFYDKPYRIFLLNKKEMVEYLEKLKEEVNC